MTSNTDWSLTWNEFSPFSQGFSWGSLVVSALFVLTTACPLVFWLTNGWVAKREEIMSSLTGAAKKSFLTAFRKEVDSRESDEKRFERFYNKWYGRKHYILPCFVLFCLCFYAGTSLGDTAQYYLLSEQGSNKASAYFHLPMVAASGISGAYAFVTYDLIVRASMRDMTSHDVIANVLRLTVCVPISYALAGLANPTFGSVVAFAVGVFPLDTINDILRRSALRQLGETESVQESDGPTLLSGIDIDKGKRLKEADISTIAQLAYCDPIQLTMRTNFEFDFIIDIVSQALAWVYLDCKLDIIRPLGLRGAIEIKMLLDEANGVDTATAAVALGVIEDLMAKLELPSESSVRYVLAQIANDARVTFLQSAYSRKE